MATPIQAMSFINQIAPLIQSEAKKRGYQVASPIIAQACIESAFNTSLLSSRYFNFFGLKCGSSWHGKSVNLKTKEEYTVGTLTTIRDNFRVYDDMLSGVIGYFDFINTKRYENLRSAPTPMTYLQLIKADGYATSSTYVQTCMACVNKYNLTQFDTFGELKNPYNVPTSVVKKGQRGDSVGWLQWVLVHKFGYDLVIDSIFGQKTEDAVKDFQTKAFVDGCVGSLTIEKLEKLSK